MLKKAIFIFVCSVLLWQVLAPPQVAEAQAQDRLVQRESLWVQIWKYLSDHPIILSLIIVTFVTIFSTVMAMVKKDKLLKSLAGQYITIELKDHTRHRGRLRVASEGLEVVAEKANQGNEKVSYLIRKDEFASNIHALVRYHDFLTDREKEEREAEVKAVYHPSIGMRLKRRVRNLMNTMRRVATEAFSLAFGSVKKQFAGTSSKYAGELEKTGEEAITYVTEAAYDSLIDRLIGTKVVVHVSKDLEYVGVLKDYTSQFIELLDVDYHSEWDITVDRGHNQKHERGLTLKKDGNDIVISSKSPFKVRLRHIYWEGDRPNAKRENINKTIEPFGQLRLNIVPPVSNVTVNPFEKLQVPIQFRYQDYKNIRFHFDSVRVADVVMLKNYGIVRNRTEKYEPKLLDFAALADTLLTEKGEELVLEGTSSSIPLSIYNGYLTNLPRERMDVAAVDQQINERWDMMSFFSSLDKKLRPVSNHYLFRVLPLWKPRRILALFSMIQLINEDEKHTHANLLPLVYYTLCHANSKRYHITKEHVMIKKRKRILGLIPRPSHL